MAKLALNYHHQGTKKESGNIADQGLRETLQSVVQPE